MDAIKNGFIYPARDIPKGVNMVITTRQGGFSQGPYDSLNLSTQVGDDRQAVEKNRHYIRDVLQLPDEPFWLKQEHGNQVLIVGDDSSSNIADAGIAFVTGKVCVVMVADCLPILIYDAKATRVAAVHCGWRGLANDLLENVVEKLDCPPADLHVWMGPAIGPDAFQVGDDVRNIFIEKDSDSALSFLPDNRGNWMANIYQLARIRLRSIGVENVSGGFYCTYHDSHNFYSYRRDGVTGRIAALAWLSNK